MGWGGWVDDTRDAGVERSSLDSGNKREEGTGTALGSVDGPQVGSVWLFRTACSFGGAAGGRGGHRYPRRGKRCHFVASPTPCRGWLPAKPLLSYTSISGRVLGAAASATHTKPGLSSGIQPEEQTVRRSTRGEPEPVLQALALLRAASCSLAPNLYKRALTLVISSYMR